MNKPSFFSGSCDEIHATKLQKIIHLKNLDTSFLWNFVETHFALSLNTLEPSLKHLWNCLETTFNFSYIPRRSLESPLKVSWNTPNTSLKQSKLQSLVWLYRVFFNDWVKVWASYLDSNASCELGAVHFFQFGHKILNCVFYKSNEFYVFCKFWWNLRLQF